MFPAFIHVYYMLSAEEAYQCPWNQSSSRHRVLGNSPRSSARAALCIKYILQSVSRPCLLRQNLLLNQMLTNWLDWLARKLQELSCLHSSCAVTSACNHTQLYHLGAEDPTSAPHNFAAGHCD